MKTTTPKRMGRPPKEITGKTMFVPGEIRSSVELMISALKAKEPKVKKTKESK